MPLARDPRPAEPPSILLVGQAPSRNEHESFAPPDDPLPPILLVGQAPGLRATIEGVPFAGISGAKLRQWFALAGFSEADFWHLIYFSAVTKCYPGRLPGAKGDRVPTPAEQALCRPWMDAQLAVLDPPIVVLVGQLAISTFLGKGPLHTFVGESFERDGRRWLPLPHPSGVSTWLNDRANQARVAHAMAVLTRWMAELGIPVSGTPTPVPG
ncbi:MAG TPA: uracil-DNA glycosylase family protein [Chloroflexia bacterium]